MYPRIMKATSKHKANRYTTQQHDKKLSINQILVNEIGRQRNDQSAISKVSRCQQGRSTPTRPSITSKVSRQGREESAVRDSSPVEEAAAGARWEAEGACGSDHGFPTWRCYWKLICFFFVRFVDSGLQIYYNDWLLSIICTCLHTSYTSSWQEKTN